MATANTFSCNFLLLSITCSVKEIFFVYRIVHVYLRLPEVTSRSRMETNV